MYLYTISSDLRCENIIGCTLYYLLHFLRVGMSKEGVIHWSYLAHFYNLWANIITLCVKLNYQQKAADSRNDSALYGRFKQPQMMKFCTKSTISTHTPIPPSSHLYWHHSTLPNRILHIACWSPPLPYTLTSISSFHPSLCVSYTSHHLDLSPTFWNPLECLQISPDNLPQPNKRFINHQSCISSHVHMPLKTCSWDGFMRCWSSLKSK
jgi:hypothetical protein